MPDDLLTTVKAALAEHDEARCCCDDGAMGRVQCPVAAYGDWLRALVARVEQAEAENARLRERWARLDKSLCCEPKLTNQDAQTALDLMAELEADHDGR